MGQRFNSKESFAKQADLAARALVSKEELKERRRLEAEDRARRRSEGEAAREAQRVRSEVIAEIEGTQPGVPLGLAPRERPAWVVGVL